MIKFTSKKQEKENFLTYIPYKKHKTWEERKGKVFLIFHHDKMVEKFFRWLVKKPYVSDIELDNLGSKVWKLIDGKNTIYDIGQELIYCFGDKCEPVYDRLIMYLRYLNKRGWIAFHATHKDKKNCS